MTTQSEQEAINQAKSANRGGGRKAKAAKPLDTNAGVGNIQAQLDKVRNDVRRSTKAYVLGGITDAIGDISRGDFGDIGDEIFGHLEGFSASFAELEDESRFQLSSTGPKKMLVSADVIDVA
jgi:hypothetical protein